MLSPMLFAFVTMILLHACSVEGAFYLVQGGCIDDPSRWTTRIDSAAENRAIVDFLRNQRVPYAGIGGYVQGGKPHWDDGSSMKWRSDWYTPPAISTIGFLLVRDDSLWDVVSYDVFPDTMFVCTDGNTEPIPPNTTEAPNATDMSITVLAPEVLDVLSVIMGKMGTFNILPFTVNGINIDVKTAHLVKQIDALRHIYHCFVGVTFLDITSTGGEPKGIATLTHVTGTIMQFFVPLPLMESNISKYAINVVVMSTIEGSFYRQTSAKLLIHTVEEVLHSVKGQLNLSEEDTLEEQSVLLPLSVTGPGTVVQDTLDLKPSVFSGLSLTMINNGIVGRNCAPGTKVIEFFFSDGKLFLYFPKDFLELLKVGNKSLCASFGNKHTIISTFQKKQLVFSAERSSYRSGDVIEVSALGASYSLFARNLYTAFLSKSERCGTIDDTSVSLELDTPIISSKVSKGLSFLQEQQENRTTKLYINVRSKETNTRYLCIRRTTTSTVFRVISTKGGEVVKILGPTTSISSSGKIYLFNGSSGAISLKNFVLPSQSVGDANHFESTFRLITKSSLRVRFVPLAIGATWNQKLESCKNFILSDGVFDANDGTVQINIALNFSYISGILCGGTEYLRIDYFVSKASEWIRKFGDSSDKVGFAVIPSLPSAALKIDVIHSEPSAHYALRLSIDEECRVGFTASLWQASNSITAVSFPKTVIGTFKVCVGIYVEPGITSLFVATNRTVSLMTYKSVMSAWEKEQGMHSGTWLPCGTSSICGYTQQYSFVEVCGNQVSNTPWPTIITDRLKTYGSFNVKLLGQQDAFPATLINGKVFIRRDVWTFQNISLLEMSVVKKVYTTSVVADREHSLVTLKPGIYLAGDIFGLIPWDQSCDTKTIHYKILVSTAFSEITGNTVSSLDFAKPLWNGENEYYILCLLRKKIWRPVPQTYVHITTRNLDNHNVSVDAITTSNPMINKELVYLWQTESVMWTVVGSFISGRVVSLALVWDDATCLATPAYTAVMHYISPTISYVDVEAYFISASPTPSSLLHLCYIVEGSSPAPLTIEQYRMRRISMLKLSLSSINYLPHYAIRYGSKENITIFLSDPLNPPITQLELFFARSPDDKNATSDCSLTSQNHVASLQVHSNAFGLRWVNILPSTVAMVGSAKRETYLLICATASKGASLHFLPVSAYLVINSVGTGTQVDPFSLDLIFSPMNGTSTILDLTSCLLALRRYVSDVTNHTVEEEKILVSEKSENHFGLFIEPGDKLAAEDASIQLRAVYKAMAAGHHLPFRVHSSSDLLFFLSFVEGLHLISQSPFNGMPRVNVGVFDGTTSVVGGDLVKQAIEVFCVLIAPIVAGFVAFSLQRTIPKLNRPKLGGTKKKEIPRGAVLKPLSKVETKKKVEAEGTEMDSPLPRRPQSVEYGKQGALVENTNTNPLYDSDDDNSPMEFGCTPPPPPPQS
ncbi:hypothetical protein LSM04_001213 [Trypanosoma melophagium]|uniref:uncharacterized protein n=1 Tax=Trypanosoma melophagium TaxID=715481 RepID=UPI00351A2726|nr:hypothetical protein LSM04_001213 [Trypanosoma melophagium]